MNIGFYLLDIGQNSYSANILQNINKLCSIRPYDNIVLFNNNFATVDVDQKYYILSMNHAKYFQGPLFLFDTESAMLTRTFTGPTKQLLYMKEPEWADNLSVPFTTWYNIYMDTRFEFIASSSDMHFLIENCWKSPIDTVSNFDFTGINNVIQKLQ